MIQLFNMTYLSWVRDDLGRQEARLYPEGPLSLLSPRGSWEEAARGPSQEVGDTTLPKGLVEP